MEQSVPHQMVSDLRRTRKYRELCEDTLYRAASWALMRHKTPKEALKAAKRKLHQVYGAYLNGIDFGKLEDWIDNLSSSSSQSSLRETCLRILDCQTSTAERVPILDSCFSDLFRETGEPTSILDLACGLNPFALPWMGVSPNMSYFAWDVDKRLISATNEFFIRTGRPPTAEFLDVLASPLDLRVDVVFLLKSLPFLEQQEKWFGARLLREANARFAVISFPARSIGGRDKGMVRHYERFMEKMTGELGLSVSKHVYPTETFYACNLDGR